MPQSIIVPSGAISAEELSVVWKEAETRLGRICSLIPADCVSDDPVPWSKPLVVPKSVCIPEPQRWTECLFEPWDNLEFRVRPSKALRKSLRRECKRFHSVATNKRHRFFPWLPACKINAIVSTLDKFNQVATTDWIEQTSDGSRFFTLEIPLNVYCSANPRLTSGGKKNSDVMLARSIFVDLENTSVEEAIQLYKRAGLPEPTMIVASGHGIHFYWRLLKAVTDLTFWTILQKSLIACLGGDIDKVIHDPVRVMRVPGFFNINGQQPTKCFIHEAEPSRRYNLTDFKMLACLKDGVPRKPKRKPSPSKATPQPPIQQPTAPLNPTERYKRSIAYMKGWSPAKVGERRSKLFNLAANLVEKFDVGLNELKDIGRRYNERLGEKLDAEEVDETVVAAHQHVHDKDNPLGSYLLREAVIPLERADSTVRTLDDWRKDIAQARTDSVSQPGHIFFDGSTTGAGKSFADALAMKQVDASATIQPTHHICEETAEGYAENGFAAAAHPSLAETCKLWGTKQNPGEAQKIQKAGLSVPRTLCCRCPHQSSCEYQTLRQQAKDTKHVVATHHRASLSDWQPFEGKNLILVHEDPLDLLRPMVKVTGRPNADGHAEAVSLRQVIAVADQARQVAADRIVDPGAVAAFTHLIAATRELIKYLEHPPTRVQSRAVALSNHAPRPCPDSLDYLLYEGMKCLNLFPPKDAVRLAIGHAFGQFEHLVLVKDEPRSDEGQPMPLLAIIGVQKVDPPVDSVVWFENAHGNPKVLERLIGRPVIDKTPQGQLAHHISPVQFAQDVTKNTSPDNLRGLIRGVLSRFPQYRKVGIITLQKQVAALNALEPFWRERIHRVEYFKSGKDRGSNSWLECDLIIILGTPRVPASAVRDKLVQLGQISDAGENGRWKDKSWEQKSTDGKTIIVRGYGYRHPAWDEAHQLLVRETMLQAVGRSRSVTEQAVPVVILSNEPLNLPFSDEELVSVNESEAKTFEIIQGLVTKSAKSDATVLVSEVVQHQELSVRQIRRIFRKLEKTGLLAKAGPRHHWRLALPLRP